MVKIRQIARPPIRIRRHTDVLTTAVAGKKPTIDSITWQKLTWVNIEHPTAEETKYLAENYPFHKLDLDDCLSKIQLPKIDEYEDYLFLVFHFPVYNRPVRAIFASQVSIFVGEDYLITLHQGDLRPLASLFKSCQTNENIREESMGHSSGYLLYLILDRLVNYCFPILNKIGENIDVVEDMIFSEGEQGMVRNVAILRRNIISFRRIIKAQTEVAEILEQKEWPLLKADPDVYYGDIADHLRKIRDTLEDYKEVVEGLSDTNNTLTSFRTNEVMRLLTIIATIMMPLTLIASIYGMNIDLPLDDNPYSFPITVILMFLVIAGMLGFFRYRHWI